MKNENPDDQTILNNVDASVTKLDELHLQELNNLKELQEIKNIVSELERKRLTAKWGEDHPGVIKAAARLSYNKELINGLNKEIEKANIKKEPLPENAWRVHGKVFDQKNAPVSGVTVFFSDANKAWIKELGNVCTDVTGYYSITVDEKL